ncbi:Hypothetical protein FKW44_008456 [Caligus rogercresseyi]|uniref:Uncharacterized protein n=1 Tax=Caligus rogercresseyi TaxID=217165 RepID=A0A7T8KGG0_CALRO|nr:Hypothetical protein FKW44_008456 [Caligus rogercresseyi]
MRESLHGVSQKFRKTVVLACVLNPRYKNHAFSSPTTLSKAKGWWKEEEDTATEQTTQRSMLPQKKQL